MTTTKQHIHKNALDKYYATNTIKYVEYNKISVL